MKTSKPWTWVPSLYFAEGLPYIAVTVLAIEIYMQLGLTDAEVTFYTSWLYLRGSSNLFGALFSTFTRRNAGG